MAFVEDFWATTRPKLYAAAKTQAFLVAVGTDEFEDAFEAVCVIARTAGAGLLPAERYEGLMEWIRDTIWREFTSAEAHISVLQDRIDAAVTADPVRYYDGLASRTSDPDRMRWAFAAFSPEYRAYLLAGRDAG